MFERVLFWAPRSLTLLFAAFLSLFAFATLGEGHGVAASASHFGMSILPTLAVLAVLAVAWRWQLLGATLFLGLAAAYIATAWGRFPLSTYLVIAGPMVIVAGLFVADWKYRSRDP